VKRRRKWESIQPISLSHAMGLCLEHAREGMNRSVDRVADQMGLTNKWVIYKWVESGRLPAILIRGFEAACGIDYVTRYLAHSAHLLPIEIPTGKLASEKDLHRLQEAFIAGMGMLFAFYEGAVNAPETVAALTELMEQAAWHRENVERFSSPELEF
jgi:hypothetical protein